MRRRDWISPGIAGLLSVAILVHLYRHQPSPATWPRCEYFRCVDCGSPASIDPNQPERWGCRGCDYSTWKLGERFRICKRDEFATVEEFGQAYVEAGALNESDPHARTLVAIWSEAGGVPPTLAGQR